MNTRKLFAGCILLLEQLQDLPVEPMSSFLFWPAIQMVIFIQFYFRKWTSLKMLFLSVDSVFNSQTPLNFLLPVEPYFPCRPAPLLLVLSVESVFLSRTDTNSGFRQLPYNEAMPYRNTRNHILDWFWHTLWLRHEETQWIRCNEGLLLRTTYKSSGSSSSSGACLG